MVADSRDYVTVAWHLSVFPAMAIMLVVLGANLLGDWLRDVLDRASEGTARVASLTASPSDAVTQRVDEVLDLFFGVEPRHGDSHPNLVQLKRRGQPLGLDQNVALVVEPLDEALQVFLGIAVER